MERQQIVDKMFKDGDKSAMEAIQSMAAGIANGLCVGNPMMSAEHVAVFAVDVAANIIAQTKWLTAEARGEHD